MKSFWFVVALVVATSAVHFEVTHQAYLPLPQLFGEKQVSMFDLWSMQHLLSGILAGSALTASRPKESLQWTKFIVAILLFGYSWEFVELFMEHGSFGEFVSSWKVGYEHWSNRLIADPILVLGGACLARRYRFAWLVAVIPCCVWFYINVTSSTSMDVQRMLFGP